MTGIPVSMPPVNACFGGPAKEEILAIRDGTERRRAIAEHPELFGLE